MDALVLQVEQMLSERLPFREIEDRIEGMSLSEEEKSALWLLAWTGQSQRVQRRSVEEALTHAPRRTARLMPPVGSLQKQVDSAESALRHIARLSTHQGPRPQRIAQQTLHKMKLLGDEKLPGPLQR